MKTKEEIQKLIENVKSIEIAVTGNDSCFDYVIATFATRFEEMEEGDNAADFVDILLSSKITTGKYAGCGATGVEVAQIDVPFVFQGVETVDKLAESISDDLEMTLSNDNQVDVHCSVEEILFNTNERIESLIEKITVADTHNIISEINSVDNTVTIGYSFSLDFAEKAIGYNLEEWAADFPETYSLDGKIEITYEETTGEIEDCNSTAEVYDCRVMKQQSSDYDGYQFDYQISKENIISYLNDFADALSNISKTYTPEPEIEVLFDGQTDSTNAYSNAYLKIGKKNDTLYYAESSNHIRHNEHDYHGRSPWEKLENFDEEHEYKSILDVYGKYFPELETIIKENE